MTSCEEESSLLGFGPLEPSKRRDRTRVRRGRVRRWALQVDCTYRRHQTSLSHRCSSGFLRMYAFMCFLIFQSPTSYNLD